MSLHLSPRKKSILNEMGIDLPFKNMAPPAENLARAFGAHNLSNSFTRQSAPADKSFAKSTPHAPDAPDAPTSKAKLGERGAPYQEKTALEAASSSLSLGSKIENMNWPELEAHLQTCRACDLGPSAPMRFIEAFDVQNTNTDQRSNIDWLIVSDAPKRALDGSIAAFSEDCMPLFNAILKHLVAVNLSSERSTTPAIHYLITHTVKCLSPSLQAPKALATQTCLIHLQQQIKLLQPKLILVMGQAAAHALLTDSPLKNEPLGRLRSKLHQFANTPMIITYAPEQMMRSGEIKSNAWTDLCWAHSLIH